MSDNDVKNTCCKELPSECKTEHTPYGNWGKRAEVFNDVTYLDNWGKSIVNSKSNAYRNYFTSCKINNKKYNSKQECDAADGDCCFFCEDFECSPNYPSASTCKDNKPNDFMKKHGSDRCSTDGRLDLEMINEWYVRNLGLTQVGNFSKGS